MQRAQDNALQKTTDNPSNDQDLNLQSSIFNRLLAGRTDTLTTTPLEATPPPNPPSTPHTPAVNTQTVPAVVLAASNPEGPAAARTVRDDMVRDPQCDPWLSLVHLLPADVRRRVALCPQGRQLPSLAHVRRTVLFGKTRVVFMSLALFTSNMTRYSNISS